MKYVHVHVLLEHKVTIKLKTDKSEAGRHIHTYLYVHVEMIY